MNISFAWTTDALLARRKRCTRRDWSREYAARFPAGSIHNAYNRNARVGGKKVGNVRITRDPYPHKLEAETELVICKHCRNVALGIRDTIAKKNHGHGTGAPTP